MVAASPVEIVIVIRKSTTCKTILSNIELVIDVNVPFPVGVIVPEKTLVSALEIAPVGVIEPEKIADTALEIFPDGVNEPEALILA